MTHQCLFVAMYISERSSSLKLNLNESTKRNAWMSLQDTSHRRATNSEECDVVGAIDIFAFLHASPLNFFIPWCTMIVQGDTTRPAVDFSELSETVKE